MSSSILDALEKGLSFFGQMHGSNFVSTTSSEQKTQKAAHRSFEKQASAAAITPHGYEPCDEIDFDLEPIPSIEQDYECLLEGCQSEDLFDSSESSGRGKQVSWAQDIQSVLEYEVDELDQAESTADYCEEKRSKMKSFPKYASEDDAIDRERKRAQAKGLEVRRPLELAQERALAIHHIDEAILDRDRGSVRRLSNASAKVLLNPPF